MAKTWDELMNRLGYDRYGAQGGDLGSWVCRELGVLKPEGLLGIHVMQIFAFPSGDPAEMADLSERDQEGLQVVDDFWKRAGYYHIQSSRPQTLAYGLNDSPALVGARARQPLRRHGRTPTSSSTISASSSAASAESHDVREIRVSLRA